MPAQVSPAGHSSFAYVGCFTSARRRARGRGIGVYRIDPESGLWDLVETFETLDNPHFLALDRQENFLYSAHGDGAEVCAYAIDKATGRLRLLNRQPTGGDNSSHLMAHQSNRYLVLATGPGVAIYPINADGSLDPHSDNSVPPGEPGPYRREQTGPHPHQAPFDPSGRWVVVPDKGLDRIHIYRFEASGGRLSLKTSVKSRYGAAPRHLAFHPSKPVAYVVNELDATVTSYNWDAESGNLDPFHRLSTAPPTHTGDNTGAEIVCDPTGKFVYVSNRGHDSIATLAVDPSNGALSPVSWHSVKGKRPRFFTLDAKGDYLYVANQDSDNIVCFKVDHGTGELTPAGQEVRTGSPSCIVFARASQPAPA